MSLSFRCHLGPRNPCPRGTSGAHDGTCRAGLFASSQRHLFCTGEAISVSAGALRAGFSPSCARVTARGRRWRLARRGRQKAPFSASCLQTAALALSFTIPRRLCTHEQTHTERALIWPAAKNSSLPGTARSRVRHYLCREPATVPDGCAVGGKQGGWVGSSLSLGRSQWGDVAKPLLLEQPSVRRHNGFGTLIRSAWPLTNG